nr:putative capsid [Marmot picobirnavirus]
MKFEIITERKRPNKAASGEKLDANLYKDGRGIVDATARGIGTYQPTGRPSFLPNIYNSTDPKPDTTDNVAIPGVLITGYMPMPIISEDNMSAPSIAASVLFQQMRRKLNKTQVGYQPADPLIMYTCFTTIMGLVEELKREFGIMNTYCTVNQYWPRAVLGALGYSEQNVTELSRNMADYAAEFNTLMYKLASIIMPVETNIGIRYQWMGRSIWEDHDSPKAQIYMYQMDYGYEYVDTDENGSKAVMVKVPHNGFRSRMSFLARLIESLRNSDSYDAIVSDWENAFPDAKTYNWETLEVDYMVKPTINDDVLQQFQNNETLPKFSFEPGSCDITQNVLDSSLYCMPEFIVEDYSAMANWNYIRTLKGVGTNFQGTDVDENAIINNTHGKLLFNYDDTDDGYRLLLLPGSVTTEVYTRHSLLMNRRLTEGRQPIIALAKTDFNTWMTLDSSHLDTIAALTYYQMCDWAPVIYPCFKYGDGSDPESVKVIAPELPYAEVDNWVEVPERALLKMNNAMQFALWRTPDEI